MVDILATSGHWQARCPPSVTSIFQVPQGIGYDLQYSSFFFLFWDTLIPSEMGLKTKIDSLMHDCGIPVPTISIFLTHKQM